MGERLFDGTPEVFHRMTEVCGATNFSLLLRNSEHIVNYVQYGCWLSSLSVDLINSACFQPHLDHVKQELQLQNTLPAELKKVQLQRPIYRKERTLLKNCRTVTTLSEQNLDEGYNIVMLGPTGSGKSRAINMMCNREVCLSKSSSRSVTQHMQLVQAEVDVGGEARTVHIMDTIGFCDTSMSQTEVAGIVKQYIKATMLRIDKVVLVCSGRLIPGHKEAMCEFLSWLGYSENKSNFSVVYTKAEDMSAADRRIVLQEVCEDLGVVAGLQLCIGDRTLPSTAIKGRERDEQVSVLNMNIVVGFPPTGLYADVEEDLLTMLDVLLLQPPRRLVVDAGSWPGCPLL